eukprot:TRINITY_DN11770_c1_g1_i1.p1 TRINITY_DN11770_c1_g1~~TRINITY_DN11770_c1_g1_i1.p1  ORF type:complete len:114 (+),score=0.56 TRINITY_DN11770_c1_g1_i1:128-469(+)
MVPLNSHMQFSKIKPMVNSFSGLKSNSKVISTICFGIKSKKRSTNSIARQNLSDPSLSKFKIPKIVNLLHYLQKNPITNINLALAYRNFSFPTESCSTAIHSLFNSPHRQRFS